MTLKVLGREGFFRCPDAGEGAQFAARPIP
jgi:hypothetical protein